MNKKLKKGITLLVVGIIVLLAMNIAFNVYNTVATPMTNQLALGQMTNDDSGADTMGRIAAEGKIWYAARWIVDLIAAMIIGSGIWNTYKGVKIKLEEKENA